MHTVLFALAFASVVTRKSNEKQVKPETNKARVICFMEARL